MGWLKRLVGGEPTSAHSSAPGPTPGTPGHAVLLHLTLSNDAFGTPEELNEMHALQDELGRAITKAAAGELDGDEFGEGCCVIYLYGPDAERLWEAIAPVLEKRPFRKGSHAIKRFGPPREGREERVNLEWDG